MPHIRIILASAAACILAVILAVFGSAEALSEEPGADDFSICKDVTKEGAISIAACSRALESGMRQAARNEAMLLLMRAQARRRSGDDQGAADDLDEAIRRAPEFLPAYEARGDLLRGHDQCDRAIADYDHVINSAPKHLSAYLARGYCLFTRDEAVRAIADFDHVIEHGQTADKGMAFHLKAQVAMAKQDYPGAIRLYDEAIKLDEKRPQPYAARAQVWALAGDEAKAAADLDTAISLSKSTPQVGKVAWRAKAQLKLKKGDLDGAIADFNNAIRLDADDPDSYLRRAAIWLEKRDFSKALEDYDKAIVIKPGLVEAYNARGDVYRQQGEYGRALADYNKAIEKQPSDLRAYSNRGLVHFFQGEFAQASMDFRRVKSEGVPNAYPLLMLYIASFRAGRPDAREELVAAANGLKAGDWPYPIIELFIGKRSLDSLTSTAANADQRCEAQFYVGLWHVLRRNKEFAKKAFQTALDTCSKDVVEYVGAQEELKRLPQ